MQLHSSSSSDNIEFKGHIQLYKSLDNTENKAQIQLYLSSDNMELIGHLQVFELLDIIESFGHWIQISVLVLQLKQLGWQSGIILQTKELSIKAK